MSKILILISIISSLFFWSSSSVSALGLDESFDGTYSNPSNWQEQNYLDRGEISFSDIGYLTLASNSYNFPFVSTVGDIFPQEFSLSIRFKYLRTDGFGTGINIVDSLPTYPGTFPDDGNIFQLWADDPKSIRIRTHVCPDDSSSCSGPQLIPLQDSADTEFHNLDVKYENQQYSFEYDGEFVFSTVSTSRKPSNIFIGNPIEVSSLLGWNNIQLDYIKIKSENVKSNQLDIRFFNQNNSDWNQPEDIYDSSQDWKDGSSLDLWGCAVSSSAMVLNYLGLTELEGSTPLDPGSLNTWLKLNNGYANGQLKWTAVMQLAKDLGTQLAYNYRLGADFAYQGDGLSTFTDHIDAGVPEIVHLAGNDTQWAGSSSHFVVAKGYSDNSVLINDPENQETEITVDYPLLRRSTFTPVAQQTQTYIELLQLEGVHLLVEDELGNKLGKDAQGQVYNDIPQSFYQVSAPPHLPGVSAAVTQEEGETPVSQHAMITADTPQRYLVTLYAETEQPFDTSVDILAPDMTERSVLDDIAGTLQAGETKQFYILFKEDGQIVVESVNPYPTSFEGLKQYLTDQYQAGKMHRLAHTMLQMKLRFAKRAYDKGKPSKAVKVLKIMDWGVDRLVPRRLDTDVAQEVHAKIAALQDKLRSEM